MTTHALYLSTAATFRRWALASARTPARKYNLEKARQHVANAREYREALEDLENLWLEQEQDEYYRSEGFPYNPETW